MSTAQDIKKKRPLSPHLQVYKPQLTSFSSILHRITGLSLTIGLLMMAWWLVSAAIGPEAYGTFMEISSMPLLKILYVGWTLAFFYHLANGIRHLFWDIGFLFKLKNAYAAGYFVLLFTVAMTGITWYCILEKMPEKAAPPVSQTLAEVQDMENAQ